MNTENRNDKWLPRTLLMCAGHFFSDVYPGFLAPILPLLMTRYNFSLTFAGFLMGVSAFSASFLQAVFGYASDRLSSRFFVIVGPIISGTFLCFLGYLPGKWYLIVFVALSGLGGAMYHPLGAKLTAKISEKHKGKAMSIFVAGGSIGFSSGPLVITAIIAYRGLSFAPVAIVPALLLAVLMYKYSPPHSASRSSSGERTLTRKNMRQILSVGVYVSIGVLRSLVIMGFNAFIPILFSFRGYSLEEGGFAVFLQHFFGGVGGLVGGYLADRVSPKKLISVSFLLATPVFYVFLHSSGVTAYVALSLAGGLLFSSIPAVITQAQATMPDHMGMVSSMVMGLSWGIGGMLVTFVGKVADAVGLVPTLNVLGFFPFIGFVLSLFLHYQRPRETRLPEYI